MRCKLCCGAAFLAALAVAAFSPYGVVTDGSRSEYAIHDDLADLIKVGGMGYERVDWDWRACQKEKGGAFDFSKYDRIVDADEARGVTVLPIVYGPPKWAYPAWQNLDGYSAFVRETVRRYGKRMPVIEIWNEQNIAGFWKDPSPTNYLALLKAAYKAAKEIDPSVRVALGGTAGWAHGFIRSLYEIGAKDYFDIVNVHPYCYPYAPEEPLRRGFAELRKIMAEFGDAAKPIWFTEIGWPTHDVDLSGPGNILFAGLKAARPERRPGTSSAPPAVQMPRSRTRGSRKVCLPVCLSDRRFACAARRRRASGWPRAAGTPWCIRRTSRTRPTRLTRWSSSCERAARSSIWGGCRCGNPTATSQMAAGMSCRMTADVSASSGFGSGSTRGGCPEASCRRATTRCRSTPRQRDLPLASVNRPPAFRASTSSRRRR